MKYPGDIIFISFLNFESSLCTLSLVVKTEDSKTQVPWSSDFFSWLNPDREKEISRANRISFFRSLILSVIIKSHSDFSVRSRKHADLII